MTDFTNMSQEDAHQYVVSLIGIDFEIDKETRTILRNKNDFILYGSGKLLDDFIGIAQEHCRKNGIKLDEAFICKHIGDIDFIKRIFDEYADAHREEYIHANRTHGDIRRFVDLNKFLGQKLLQMSHKDFVDTIKGLLNRLKF